MVVLFYVAVLLEATVTYISQYYGENIKISYIYSGGGQVKQ